MAKRELEKLASILVVIGGVILLVIGLAQILGSAIMLPFMPYYLPLGRVMWFGRGIEEVVGGIVALVGSRSAASLVWGVILIVIGLILGGIGGTLVLIGGILGLVAKYV